MCPLAHAQTTLQLSPLLVTKLNQLGADLYGINGQDNVPTSTTAFLERLRVIISSARAHATVMASCMPALT